MYIIGITYCRNFYPTKPQNSQRFYTQFCFSLCSWCPCGNSYFYHTLFAYYNSASGNKNIMKLAIVTGASGNLGQVVVKKFLVEGFKVIGTVIPNDPVPLE